MKRKSRRKCAGFSVPVGAIKCRATSASAVDGPRGRVQRWAQPWAGQRTQAYTPPADPLGPAPQSRWDRRSRMDRTDRTVRRTQAHRNHNGSSAIPVRSDDGSSPRQTEPRARSARAKRFVESWCDLLFWGWAGTGSVRRTGGPSEPLPTREVDSRPSAIPGAAAGRPLSKFTAVPRRHSASCAIGEWGQTWCQSFDEMALEFEPDGGNATVPHDPTFSADRTGRGMMARERSGKETIPAMTAISIQVRNRG